MVEEVGRFRCEKCGQPIVATGHKLTKFRGIGAHLGPCPWGCGAWINRGFRVVKPGDVRVHRAEDWDRRPSA